MLSLNGHVSYFKNQGFSPPEQQTNLIFKISIPKLHLKFHKGSVFCIYSATDLIWSIKVPWMAVMVEI